MNPARRQLLTGALALGLAPRALAAGKTPGQLATLARWASGDRNLVPASLSEGKLLFAGERTLGLLDPAASTLPWQVAHGIAGGARFRPRGHDGIVLCGGRTEIAAWRPGEQQALWRYRAVDQIGTPCLAGRLACFGDGHKLLAVDLENGRILWHFAAIADTRISYAPVVAGDTLFVGPGDGRLYALSLADGQLRWQVDRMQEWQYLRQLNVDGTTLVAGSYKEKLYGLDPGNGQQRWEFSAGNFINSQHVADGLACLWSPTGWVYAIDTTSGKIRWRHRTNDYRGGVHNWGALMAELVSNAKEVHALDLNNVLHVLARDDGRALADLKLPEPVRPFVTLLGDRRLICAGNSGDLLLLEMPPLSA